MDGAQASNASSIVGPDSGDVCLHHLPTFAIARPPQERDLPLDGFGLEISAAAPCGDDGERAESGLGHPLARTDGAYRSC